MSRTQTAPETPALAASPARVRSVALPGPAGRLEAVLNEGVSGAPLAALLCHPHPLGGGNLHNKVVYHAMKAMNAPEWGLGWPVLRFNFRGTGLSEGAHHGTEEMGDVLAALSWLRDTYGLPVVLAGFSFGAAMSLAAACSLDVQGSAGLRALAALGMPLQSGDRTYAYPFLQHCALPKLFLSGDHDAFAPADALRSAVAVASHPSRLALVPGANHFFTGHLARMQEVLRDWLKEFV